MGSHKAGSSNLSPLPPCISPSLLPPPLSPNIERELSFPPPHHLLGQEEAEGWEVVGVGGFLPFHMHRVVRKEGKRRVRAPGAKL